MTERATRIRAGELSPRTRAHAAGDEILLLNGPSLNLLGEREPERYGTTTLDEIETRVAAAAEAAGMTLVDSFQSNHEGDLIDRLHVRDFSAHDTTVRPAWRGKYLAFTEAQSAGMRHLRALRSASDGVDRW